MKAKLLIIDDETNIRTMMKLALAHVGYEVDTAASGPEGLEKYGTGEQYDLVLLDQRMPGMPGIEVQREILNRNPEARLILVTAFGTIDLALEAIQAGAQDFLRKPFTADTLRNAVQTALERPIQHYTAVPAGMVCQMFRRTTINGFSFELESESVDETVQNIECEFVVHHGDESSLVKVILPAYIQELVKAHADSDDVPGGSKFWAAMCEESLANYLWHNATLPEHNHLRIEELSPNLQNWLESMLTVSVAD